MIEERFTTIRKKNPVSQQMGNYIQDNGTTVLKLMSLEDCKDVCELLNGLVEENKQLKQEINNITFICTQNRVNISKDKLYIRDNNTEIDLKEGNIHIEVFLPNIKEHFKFDYMITGRKLERRII